MGCGASKETDAGVGTVVKATEAASDTPVPPVATEATTAAPVATEAATAAPEDDNVLTVVVSGAAGQIGYSLLPLLANGKKGLNFVGSHATSLLHPCNLHRCVP